MTQGRLLITGGSGFTGRHLANAAMAGGFDVVLLKANLLDKDAVLIEIDALRPDFVIHLAAISAVTHADENAFYQVNLFGTLNLLDGLVSAKISLKKVILASSANVYGNAIDSPIREDTCPQPVNHYAMSKFAMERMSLSSYANKLPLVIARPFNYTGVGHDERFVIPKIVRHFSSGEPVIELGNINVEREFNDVRVVCGAYTALLIKGVEGEVYNICSGNPVRLSDVLSELTALTQHTIRVVTNQRYLRKNEIQRLTGSPEKLEQCIGYLPPSDLKGTLAWMLRPELGIA